MKTLITVCVLLVCSGCVQVTSNSRMEIEQGKVTIYNEKKANWILTTVDLKNLKWDGLTIDKGKAVPEDVEVVAPIGVIKTNK